MAQSTQPHGELVKARLFNLFQVACDLDLSDSVSVCLQQRCEDGLRDICLGEGQCDDALVDL